MDGEGGGGIIEGEEGKESLNREHGFSEFKHAVFYEYLRAEISLPYSSPEVIKLICLK